MAATKYRADKADVMDIAVSNHLCSLDAASLAALQLCRKAAGRYEVDGRQITLRWRSARSSDILVHEDGVAATKGDMLLAQYLQQAANVAKLRAPGAVASDAPMLASQGSHSSQQLSKVSPQKKLDKSVIDDLSVWSEIAASERIASMHRACQEAKFDLQFTV